MEIFARIVIAVFVFVLFGWIGLAAGGENVTWTDAIITGLLGVCTTFIVFDIVGKSNDSKNDNKK